MHFLCAVRAPVGGLGKLSLVIQRGGEDSDRLPSAHTCAGTFHVNAGTIFTECAVQWRVAPMWVRLVGRSPVCRTPSAKVPSNRVLT